VYFEPGIQRRAHILRHIAPEDALPAKALAVVGMPVLCFAGVVVYRLCFVSSQSFPHPVCGHEANSDAKMQGCDGMAYLMKCRRLVLLLCSSSHHQQSAL
jgi:hypothetical protein